MSYPEKRLSHCQLMRYGPSGHCPECADKWRRKLMMGFIHVPSCPSSLCVLLSILLSCWAEFGDETGRGILCVRCGQGKSRFLQKRTVYSSSAESNVPATNLSVAIVATESGYCRLLHSLEYCCSRVIQLSYFLESVVLS